MSYGFLGEPGGDIDDIDDDVVVVVVNVVVVDAFVCGDALLEV